MINSPPSISPRLRGREPVGITPPVVPMRPPEQPGLRVLIRLPQITPPSASAGRFQFAASMFTTMFTTLKRRYAAVAFGIFVVCVAVMLIRGKRPAPPQDDGGEAPRWTSAVTVSPSKPAAAAPIAIQTPKAVQQPATAIAPRIDAAIAPRNETAAAPRNEATAPWALGPQRGADTARQPLPGANSWQPPAGSAAAVNKPNGSLPDDRIPNMPTSPFQNSVANRPSPAAPALNNGSNMRIAGRDAAPPPAPSGSSIYTQGQQQGVATFNGYIGAPAPNTNDAAGQRTYR